MVIGLVVCLLVWLYGYWFGYMVTGFLYMFFGLVIWSLVGLYGYWFGYWLGYIVTRLVIGLVEWLLVCLYG